MKKVISTLIFICTISAISAQAPKNLQLLGTLTFPGQTLAGCWHYKHASGAEYALLGAANGIAIVDVSNPALPDLLFQLPGVQSLWHEVKVNGDFAYAVSEGQDLTHTFDGMQIIDLRYLPDSAPFKFYRGDGAIFNLLETGHSITVDDNYVYINGHNIFNPPFNRGVIIANISDPWNPVFTGSAEINYCHDSYVIGNRLYTSDIFNGLFTVYDITDHSNPVQIANQATPGAFNHNTWLSDDGNTIFTTDEQPGAPLASFDISDINNISLLDTFYNFNFAASEVHNVRVLNDFLIAPSYGSQLTLIDADRPANLIEVGNYTTGSSLCWDADPYLPSGIILATDMNSGVFYVFGPTYIRACYLEGTVTDTLTGFPLNNVSVTIVSPAISSQTDLSGGYRTGYADSGMYAVTYAKTGYFTKTLQTHLQNGILTVQDVELVPLNIGITDAANQLIKVFPDPVTEQLNFILPDNKYKVVITNSVGQKLFENEFEGGNYSVDVSSFSKGLLNITLQNESGFWNKKIMRN
jgi:choice-of-anchor B domain-containing protein